jgi:MscS family membrane protein
VLGFLRAAEAKNYAKAAQYLEGNRSEKEGEELALQLKYLLDLGLSTSINDLSRSPTGNSEDTQRVSRELVGTVKTPRGNMDVLLDLIKRPDEPPIWLFSKETLRQVPAIYASVQHKGAEEYFPEWATRITFLSVPLWRWGTFLLIGLLSLVLASLVTRLTLWVLRLSLRKTTTGDVEAGVLRLRGPVFGLILAIALRVVAGYAITALSRHNWDVLATVAAWFSGAWLLARLTDLLVAYQRGRYLRQMQWERVTMIGLAGRFFKILIGIILGLLLLRMAGVDVSAVLAGLGIGGVALALAAQSTLADLFGGLSVVLRGAVRVGDFCQIDGTVGTVEDIGVSAVSVRTLSRSMVSIPNSKVAQVKPENFTMRDQYLIQHAFTLRFDTPYRVVKTVLGQFTEALMAHPEIVKDSARATLINLTASGPQIEVFAYFRRPGADWATFLGEQEKIILKMLRIVEEEGTSLAAPIGIVQMPTEYQSAVPVDTEAKTV